MRVAECLASGVAAALALAGGAGHAQTPYRVVTPDGKVLYTDQPPVSQKARVTEIQPPTPQPGAQAPALRPPAPLHPAGAQPPIGQAPPIPPEVMMPATTESRAEHRECMMKNARQLQLIAASREVIRTRDRLQRDGAQAGGTAFGESERSRVWNHYKSLGGTAASPEDVRVPEDPCSASAERFGQQAEAAQREYQACVAAKPREMRLMSLSNQVAMTRNALAMVERMQEEKRRDPAAAKAGGPKGEWRMLERVDPAAARAELSRSFSEYRAAGGAAARAEDVQPLPNPCLAARGEPRAPESSPVRRQAVLFPAKK